MDKRTFAPLLILLALVMTGCSQGSGQSVELQPDFSNNNSGGNGVVLSGPPPQTDDVQRFRLELWENIAPENRCGQCHGEGGQAPTFARADDINRAYEAANGIVNLSQPSLSRMVEKVAGGHNCWQASDSACGDILTTWISNWAGESSGDSNTIVLTAPEERDPGASKSFPSESSAFAATIHPLLTTYCASCHTETAAIPQSPFFGAADADAAYEAAKTKIELDNPEASRLVVRLASEFHNCWSNCSANGAEMQAAIESFVGTIPETEVDPELVTSKALTILDGVVASGGGRQDGNAIALYEFKTLAGNTAFDTSGVDPAMNLNFTGPVTWVGGWGVQFGAGSRAQASTGTSRKLYDLITATGEYSIEVWAAPANVTQEEARIVSYSGGNTSRNFTLGQTLYNYDFLARTSVTDGDGNPALSTPDADEVLQATLQHVVVTYDPTQGRQIYVNGVRIEVSDEEVGTLNDWDDTFAFVLGNEVSGSRQWQGVLRLAAIHNRSLTATQVLQNFEAGVGEQFFLLFGISHIVDIPEAYIVFSVSQFDNYSYLFSNPFFYSLDSDASFAAVEMQGLRIGINGREPEVGQAYQNLDVMLGDDTYVAGVGQTLSEIGTIFGIEKGSTSDEFFLTFERLGNATQVRVEAGLEPEPVPADGDPVSDIGIKIFAEVNAGMSQITGVPLDQPAVLNTYLTVRQQLPVSDNIEGFLSSQQMGITQLAISYCNALIEDSTLAGNFFPSLDLNSDPSVALSAANRNLLIDPLLNKVLDSGVSSQPDRVEAEAELSALIDVLAATGSGSERTRSISKASCAAMLGSAALLIQ